MTRLSLVADILGYLPFEEMLDTVSTLGFEAVELGCGNWSNAPHLRLDDLPAAYWDIEDTKDRPTDTGFVVNLQHAGGVHSHLSASTLNRLTMRELRAYGEHGSYVSSGTDVQTQAIFAGQRPGDDPASWSSVTGAIDGGRSRPDRRKKACRPSRDVTTPSTKRLPQPLRAATARP
ncbi:hypothetical protein [Rhizobium rhizogenes]|uniref:hypothetical protein n=1 Tax=Rhizobium rhizogenes TaxID=359 RepID=UPI00191DF991|nr:hypothetical protein [Rhizobium rhizogenes]